MSKVVLINPASHSSRSGGVGQPIGLLSIASSLVGAGHAVSLIDCNCYDVPFDTAVLQVKRKVPDVVGLSVNTLTIDWALRFAKRLKMFMPKVRIVFGGIHSTIFADDIIKLPYVDCVVRGEGELAVLDAVNRKGVYEESIDDLDKLFVPAWQMVRLGDYRNSLVNKKFGMVMASRGCSFDCSFCSAHIMCGRKVRFRSAWHVEQELETLRNLGVEYILFEDDTFTLDDDWVYSICDVLSKHKFRWWCNSRVDTLKPDVVTYMNATGCEGICFGIESGNQHILDLMGKGVTLEQIREGVDLAKSVGVKTYGYFMIGCPEDTRETLRETVDFAKSLPLDFAQFSIATPFPATRLFEYAKEKGVVGERVDWRMFDWEGEPPNISNVSVKERRKWIKRAIREFYLRPSIVRKNFNFKGLRVGWRMLRG